MKYILPFIFFSFVSCQKENMTSNQPIEVTIERTQIDYANIPLELSTTQVSQKILVIGDSEAGFVSRRFKEIKQSNETIDLECKGGTTIQYWSEGGAFHRALQKHPSPDIVIVFLGTNNYWNTKLPNTEPILAEIKKERIKCIWVGPTAVKGKHWPINDLLRENVSSTCIYVDTEALHIPLEDGVHPTHEGILKWLNAVWNVKNGR